jgi:hypothetical protein
MNPLPDRTVILALLVTVGLCFALVFWFVRLQPQPEPPLQWRQGPSARHELQAAPAPLESLL